MKKLTLSQVGLLLQAIYDTETHLKLEWMWDGGFDFSFGIDGCFQDHPSEIQNLYKTIDVTKLEEVASLILMEYEMKHDQLDSNGELNSMGKFIKSLPA